MSNKEVQEKAVAVATVAIDKTGLWHCTYVGHYVHAGQNRFGNNHLSDRSIEGLLKKVRKNLLKSRQIYLDKIRAGDANDSSTTETAEPESSESGLRDSGQPGGVDGVLPS